MTTTSPTDHDPIAEDPVLVDAGGSPTRRSRRSRRFGLLAALAAGVLFLAACEKPPYQMVFPVAGSPRFSNTFGAPRGPNFSHQGEDIFAPKGTPLIAVTDGTITHMRWGTGTRSGNLVQLTDDGGWFYYYIHLNNDSPGTDDGVNRYDQAFADGITIGQRVKAGEVIGYLGDAGDAENTAPHLHFEVHKPGTGAIDPIRVSAYVAGNLIATVTANGDRGDLASRGRGTRHGFVFPSVGARGGGPVPKGAEICVVAHSIGGGGSSRIGCSTAPK